MRIVFLLLSIYLSTTANYVVTFTLSQVTFMPLRNGGEGGIRTLDRATNPILP